MTGNGREMSAKQATDAVARVFADKARKGVREAHEHIIHYARALLAENQDVPPSIVEYLLERAESGRPKHRPVESENWRRDVRLAGRIHALLQTGLGPKAAAQQAIEGLPREVEERISLLVRDGIEPERAVLTAIPTLGHESAEDLRNAITEGHDPLETAQQILADWDMEPSNALRAHRTLYPLES